MISQVLITAGLLAVQAADSQYQPYMKRYAGGQGGDYQQYMKKYAGGQGGDYQQYMHKYAGDYEKYFNKYTHGNSAKQTGSGAASLPAVNLMEDSKKDTHAVENSTAIELVAQADQGGGYQQYMQKY